MDTLSLFIQSLPKLLEGLQYTLLLTFLSIIVGFGLGILLALGRVYGNKPLSYTCTSYIEIIRGTPLLVQLFILYFGLPAIGIGFSPLMAAFIGLSLNSGAYQAEYIRGSLQSIGSGQMIAARTIGMSTIKSLRHVILPQALRMTIPAWSNELIYLLKYSSLAYLIRVEELFAEARFIASDVFRYIEMFGFVAIIYLILTIILTEIVDKVEEKVRIPGIGAVKGEREA